MIYPTIDEVRSADRYQICKWYRFLPSPGTSAIGRDDFHVVLAKELEVMKLLTYRMKELGGFTPEISKELGF
jgi:hypothetical protein